MYFVKRNPDFRTISTFIRCYSLAKRSHYEVLNLRKNCTDKEIKEAFINMSKEYHPDKNKDAKAQEQFVRIVEAYNVLSKPGSRAQYDCMTEVERNSPYHSSPFVYRTHESYGYNPKYNHYQYYESQSKTKSQQTEERSYYGINGLKKVPNYVIILLCFGVAFVGTMLQLFVIRELYVVHKRQAIERSKYLGEELERVRAAARENGHELQTRLLLEKIVSAANPTVATASLGQALANEKKFSEYETENESHETQSELATQPAPADDARSDTDEIQSENSEKPNELLEEPIITVRILDEIVGIANENIENFVESEQETDPEEHPSLQNLESMTSQTPSADPTGPETSV